MRRSAPPWPRGRRRTSRSGPTAAPPTPVSRCVRAHGTLGAAVTGRLNRMPRRLALAQLDLAGVRARPGASAAAVLGLVVADRATGPVEVAAESVLVTPAGATGPALETEHGCTALPGRVAAVAVMSDGCCWSTGSTTSAGWPRSGPDVDRRPSCGSASRPGSSRPACSRLAVRLAPRPGRPTAVRSTALPARAASGAALGGDDRVRPRGARRRARRHRRTHPQTASSCCAPTPDRRGRRPRCPAGTATPRCAGCGPGSPPARSRPNLS